MHPYSTNSPANPKLIAILALASGAVASALSLVVNLVNAKLGWALGGFSTLTVFGALYFLFNGWVWRWRLARKVLLVPDLNGTWTCDGRTVMKNGQPVEFPWHGTMTISQSWSRVAIVLRTTQSHSRSIAASLYRLPAGDEYELIYHYGNQPGVGEHQLQRHSGLCRLVFDRGGLTGSGDYFTDRDRVTVGTMRLTKQTERRTDGKA